MSSVAVNNRFSNPNIYNIEEYRKPPTITLKDDAFNSVKDAVIEKYESKFDKYEQDISKAVVQKQALEDLQGVSSTFEEAVKQVSTTVNIMGNTKIAQNVPDDMTVEVTSAAAMKTYDVEVRGIASTQKIIISGKDAGGNQVSFPSNPNTIVTGVFNQILQIKDVDNHDVGVTVSQPGTFARGERFFIMYQATNSDVENVNRIEIRIPDQDLTLDGVVKFINDQINITNPGAGINASIISDSTGRRVVLESSAVGTGNNFYIDALDIKGLDERGLEGGGNTFAVESALTNLSVLNPSNEARIIDLYNKYGQGFSATGNWDVGEEDKLSSFKWNIGGVEFVFGDLLNPGPIANPRVVVNTINKDSGATGITAKFVEINGRYVIRIESGIGMNYAHEDLEGAYGFVPNIIQVRTSSAGSTNLAIDGVPYIVENGTTLTAPNPNIASITVSKIEKATISISQDTGSLQNSIVSFVNAINSAQQFVAKQQTQETEFRFSREMNGISGMINTALIPTSSMSLAQMGITWEDYVPTRSEREAGAVSTKQLKIDSKKLANVLSTKLDDVKRLFAGSLTQTNPGTSTVTLSSLRNALSVSRFDLTITRNGANEVIATATNYGNGGGSVELTYTPTSQSTGTIAGKVGTIFSGLYMSYSRNDGNPIPAIADVSNISLTKGVTVLGDPLKSDSKNLTNSVTAVKEKIAGYKKDAKATKAKRDGEIKKAQHRAKIAEMNKQQGKEMQKVMDKLYKSILNPKE